MQIYRRKSDLFFFFVAFISQNKNKTDEFQNIIICEYWVLPFWLCNQTHSRLCPHAQLVQTKPLQQFSAVLT